MKLAELLASLKLDGVEVQTEGDPEQKPAGDPEPEQKPAGDPEPEQKPAGDPEQKPAGDPSSQNLTADNVKDIIKEELTEFLKDFQSMNRSKDASGAKPEKTALELLQAHYEE